MGVLNASGWKVKWQQCWPLNLAIWRPPAALTSVVSVEQQKPDWRGENPKYNYQEYQGDYKIVSETSDEIKNNTAKETDPNPAICILTSNRNLAFRKGKWKRQVLFIKMQASFLHMEIFKQGSIIPAALTQVRQWAPHLWRWLRKEDHPSGMLERWPSFGFWNRALHAMGSPEQESDGA